MEAGCVGLQYTMKARMKPLFPSLQVFTSGQEFDVLFAKPSDPELESKIDQAYLKKYSGSSYVSAMTGIRARAATIEILPS